MFARRFLFTLALVATFPSCAGEAPELADILTPQEIAEDLKQSGDPGENLDAPPTGPTEEAVAPEPVVEEKVAEKDSAESAEEPAEETEIAEEEIELPQEAPTPAPKPIFVEKPKLPENLALHGNRSRLVIVVDRSEQRLYVIEKGELTRKWLISSGAPGMGTPDGIYPITRMHKKYTSKQFKARMDDAIFFFEGYALHATYGSNIKLLGPRKEKSAQLFGHSHGCVRQDPPDAAELFELARYHGARNVTIVIQK